MSVKYWFISLALANLVNIFLLLVCARRLLAHRELQFLLRSKSIEERLSESLGKQLTNYIHETGTLSRLYKYSFSAELDTDFEINSSKKRYIQAYSIVVATFLHTFFQLAIFVTYVILNT